MVQQTSIRWNSIRVTLALLLSTGLTLPASAQSYYGGLRGTVLDPHGSAVPTAKVKIADQGTGAVRTTLSGGEGEFVFPELVPGTYTVEVEAPGFKKFERKDVVVGTQQQVSLDRNWRSGRSPKASGHRGGAAGGDRQRFAGAGSRQPEGNRACRTWAAIRSCFRSWSQNVIPVGNPAYNRMEDQSGSSQISISGGPVRGNNYLIDGVPITDADESRDHHSFAGSRAGSEDPGQHLRRRNGAHRRRNVQHADEVRAPTPTMAALYGHLRRTDWDANSFFNNAAGVPITNQPNDTWGASFGGRVMDPESSTTARIRLSSILAFEHYDDTQSASLVVRRPHRAGKDRRLFEEPYIERSAADHLRSARRGGTRQPLRVT